MRGLPKGLPCHVCERAAARIFYNGQVCNACRVFFYRAINEEQNFECLRDKRCEIHYKLKRFCLYCRYEKCKRVNMNPKEVGKKAVKPRLAVFYTTGDRKTLFREIYGGILGNTPEQVLQYHGVQNILEWVSYMMNYSLKVFCSQSCSPSLSYINTTMDLKEVLKEPDLCIDRSTAACDIISNDPLAAWIPFDLMASAARSAVAVVDLMKLMNEFRRLSVADQKRLVQHGCLLLSTFILRYQKHRQRIDDVAFQNHLNRFQMSPEMAERLKVNSAFRCYERSDELFQQLQPTDEEMLLIQLNSLFHSYPDLSQFGGKLALQCRTKLTYMLQQYLVQRFPNCEKRQVLERIQGLFEIGNLMREISELNEPIYVNALVQNGGMQTALGFDLFYRWL